MDRGCKCAARLSKLDRLPGDDNASGGMLLKFLVSAGRQLQKHPTLANLGLELKFDRPSAGRLYVKARFNEDESATLFGTIRFHLRRAVVHIECNGCKLGDINAELDSEIKLQSYLEHEFEYTDEKSTLSQDELNLGPDINPSSPTKLPASVKSSRSFKAGSKGRHKLTSKDTFANVVVGGSERALQFSFESSLPTSALRGRVPPEDWCEVTMESGAARITATLATSERDIIVVGTGGIWPENISKDKSFLIRLYALRLLDWKNYLSLMELDITPSREELVSSYAIDPYSPTMTILFDDRTATVDARRSNRENENV